MDIDVITNHQNITWEEKENETRTRTKRADADEDRDLFDRDGRPRDLRLLPDSRETQPTRHASANAQQRLRSKFRI